MAEILIISIPDGDAPEKIRKAWIGLKLPTFDITDHGIKIVSMSEIRCLGYLVPKKEALDILRAKEPLAAEWWDKLKMDMSVGFIFPKTCCKLL